MRKLFFMVAMILASTFVFAQSEEVGSVQLERGDKTLEISTSISRPTYIDFGGVGTISLTENNSRILLWHLNNLIEIMDLVDESAIDIPYKSRVAMMHVGYYTNRRLGFRIRIGEDGEQVARVGVLEEVALENFFLSRAEVEQLISVVESSIQRHDEMVSQASLLNEQIREMY